MAKIIKLGPRWKCKDCGRSGSLELGRPIRCPNCRSTKIRIVSFKTANPFPNG